MHVWHIFRALPGNKEEVKDPGIHLSPKQGTHTVGYLGSLFRIPRKTEEGSLTGTPRSCQLLVHRPHQ